MPRGTLDPAAFSTVFDIRGSHPLSTGLPRPFVLTSSLHDDCLSATPEHIATSWFGLFRVSLATTCGISVDFFSSPYLDVSVQAVPRAYTIGFMYALTTGMNSCRVSPFVTSPDITLICSSPRLFAAYHVLLRLLMPRHSPCALVRLTTSEQAPHPLLSPFGGSKTLLCLLQALVIRKVQYLSYLISLIRIMQALLKEVLLWLNCILP